MTMLSPTRHLTRALRERAGASAAGAAPGQDAAAGTAAKTAPKNPMLNRAATPYYLLLGATLLLLVLGLVMVFSASSVVAYKNLGSSYAIVSKQAMWAIIGLPVTFVGSRLPVRAWRALAYPGLVASVALLFLVVIAGTKVNGNRNWIDFGGPFRIQPSELAKLAIVLWGADLLTRKDKLLGQWKHLLVPLVPAGAFVTMLVLLGGDLGTALILIAIVGSLLYIAGAPMRLFVGGGAAAVALVAYMVQTHTERMSRITAWLDPAKADPLNEGLQALHGKFALATGGWWGTGLGASKEKWGSLPEAHTDFIFAILGEELGLVGTLAVLALFGVVGYAGLRVALHASDPFVRYAAGGVTGWIMIQAFINIGAVLGILPITGVPLPLVSYGGSALVPTMVGLGMLLSFARQPRRVARPRPAATRT